METSFINELHNTIQIRIKKEETQINIQIEGPESLAEWIITKQEASELYKLLKTCVES